MGIFTDIEWCDSTVNPTAGCDGCELWNRIAGIFHCYAGPIHERFGAPIYTPTFEQVALRPGRMAKAAAWSDLTGKARPTKPWLDGLPRHIFVGDMGDVFSRDVPFDYLDRELIQVACSDRGSRHVWMVLTKQARRLRMYAEHVGVTFGPWPMNVLPGVSVTGPMAVRRAVEAALQFQGHYFLSVEPLLAAVDLRECFSIAPPRLVIVGGESRKDARPFRLEWGLNVMSLCDTHSVPLFWKQMGSHVVDLHGERIRLRDPKGGDPAEWPSETRVREFPR